MYHLPLEPPSPPCIPASRSSKEPGWLAALCRDFPPLSVSHMMVYVCRCCSCTRPTLSLLHWAHKSLLCSCVSSRPLQTGSSGPFFLIPYAGLNVRYLFFSPWRPSRCVTITCSLIHLPCSSTTYRLRPSIWVLCVLAHTVLSARHAHWPAPPTLSTIL